MDYDSKIPNSLPPQHYGGQFPRVEADDGGLHGIDYA
jgi:hypothetical protein